MVDCRAIRGGSGGLSSPRDRYWRDLSMFSFDIVSGKIAKDILDGSVATVVDLVEDAYLRHDAGRTVNPDSYFLRFPGKPDARIIALPAFIGLAECPVAGIKWISSFPENVSEG